MNEKMNLKHCPICGGLATMEEVPYPTGTLQWISCKNPDCWFLQGATENTKEKAAKKWNQRASNWVPAEAPPGADPEDDGDHSSLILIYGADGMVFLGYYDTYHEVYWDSDTCRKIENAAYWMPIQEPDREEEP